MTAELMHSSSVFSRLGNRPTVSNDFLNFDGILFHDDRLEAKSFENQIPHHSSGPRYIQIRDHLDLQIFNRDCVITDSRYNEASWCRQW